MRYACYARYTCYTCYAFLNTFTYTHIKKLYEDYETNIAGS